MQMCLFGVLGGYILFLYVLKIAFTHSTWWCPQRIAAEPSLSCFLLASLALSHWKMTGVSHVSVALRTFSMKASLTPGGRFSFIRVSSISLISLLIISQASSFLHLKRWSWSSCLVPQHGQVPSLSIFEIFIFWWPRLSQWCIIFDTLMDWLWDSCRFIWPIACQFISCGCRSVHLNCLHMYLNIGSA